jgi:hypothetical protein
VCVYVCAGSKLKAVKTVPSDDVGNVAKDSKIWGQSSVDLCRIDLFRTKCKGMID